MSSLPGPTCCNCTCATRQGGRCLQGKRQGDVAGRHRKTGGGAQGAEVLIQQHQRRHTDFRKGRRLGARDHIVAWPKPKTFPDWLTREQYDAFPDTLEIREVKVHSKVLVTTLLCATQAPKKALGELYASRWNVELDLRNLKTTSIRQSMFRLFWVSRALSHEKVQRWVKDMRDSTHPRLSMSHLAAPECWREAKPWPGIRRTRRIVGGARRVFAGRKRFPDIQASRAPARRESIPALRLDNPGGGWIRH